MHRTIITFIAGLLAGQLAPGAATAASWEHLQPSARIWLRKIDPDNLSRRSDAERPWVNAKVREADVERGALTVRHAAMSTPKMPAMTMTFPMKDPAHLRSMKRGDQIAFQAADIDGVIRIVNVRMLH